MDRLSKDFDAISCKSNVCIANCRAGQFVGFLQTNLQLVTTGRQTTKDLCGVGQICSVRSWVQGINIARPYAYLVGARGAHCARQDNAEPSILLIGAVQIVTDVL